ncbi:DUF4388 domain-containing protein [Vulgatibacter incomptus]|uniref:Response regulator receiver protein n=1 Tax=Vulgatibacter incomptus TaxID=1391653 RepID=A0A0K1PEI9_9BACT|nr:DUF4388 domain-containing protein [Vulgatibacter incomptus]AKU91917.1 response regulator receiver protein [Vulgatibacter incomptus]
MISTPSSAQGRTILIADPDAEAVRRIGPLLRDRGFQIHAASDGSQALQLTLLRHPDLVLIDEACGLIEPSAFVRILRSNPRTEAIPVLLTGRNPAPALLSDVEGSLRKPYRQDELLGRIDQLLRGARGAAPDPESELRGRLTHLKLPDLLQAFAINRRTCRLIVRGASASGEVDVVEGRIYDARMSGIVGLKAVYRLLVQEEGSFEVHAGRADVADRFGLSLDRLLLDALHHSDELARVTERLPGRSERLELAVEGGALAGSAAQIAARLRQGSGTVAELLDRCESVDLEAAQALDALLRDGAVRRASGPAAATEAPLLDPSELHALRQRILRSRPSSRVLKVLVAFTDEAGFDRAIAHLARLPGFGRSADPGELGTFATIDLGEEVVLDLVGIRLEAGLRPLWAPLAAGALGVTSLDTGPGFGELAEVLGASGVPLRLAAPDPVAALRELLGAALV